MTDLSQTKLVTFKVSNLNTPIKQQILSDWINEGKKMQAQTTRCLLKGHIKYRDTNRLNSKRKKI